MGLLDGFDLVDHAGDDGEPELPEIRIGGVEAEGLQELGMMLAAASPQEVEIFADEAGLGLLVAGIERIHQAVAESVGVDIEGRMNEVGDVGPEHLVAVLRSEEHTSELQSH